MLVLMNGQTMEGKVINVTPLIINYTVKKKNKTQIKEIDAERVFSILYGDGHTQILYTQDSIMGYDYSVSEMQYFIMGEQDAIKYFKAPGATIAGFALAAAGGFFLAESFLVLMVPFVSSSIHTIPGVRINSRKIPNPGNLEQETYIRGYKRIAKSKRIQNAIKGSLLGVLAGVATFKILDNNQFFED